MLPLIDRNGPRHHPMHAGERLLFVDPEGYVRETNGWQAEVEDVAIWDGDMPSKVIGLDTDTLAARDLTTAFEIAVREASEPEAPFPSSYVIREGRAA